MLESIWNVSTYFYAMEATVQYDNVCTLYIMYVNCTEYAYIFPKISKTHNLKKLTEM